MKGLKNECIYNAAKEYSVQLKKGDEYHLLNPVIVLTITDFDLFPEQKELISHYKRLEKSS